MNNQIELIARAESIQYRLAETKKVCKVHGFVASFTRVFDDTDTVIIDCRAEIERLTHNNEVMTSLCQDCAADIKRLEARIAELEKPYVPMTDDEVFELTKKLMADGHGYVNGYRVCAIEATTIKRYNEQRGVE